jgi:hypothetical protein
VPTISEIRQQYPQYQDMSDTALADALHQKFYADIPRADFDQKIGLASAEPADHGLSARQKLSPVQKAINPITSYPETYEKMNRESREQMSQGVEQIKKADGALETAKGIGNTAIGAAGYLSSPISAAYRSIVGQPVEDVTGIPREYTEFAAQLATPGIGMTGAVKPPSAPNFATRVVRGETPSVGALKAAAKADYESSAVKGLQVDPKAVADFTTGLKSRLNEMGVNDILAPKTFAILNQAENVPAGAIMTGQNLRALQKTLGKASQSADPQERLAATKALIDFNKHLENLPAEHVVSGNAADFSQAVTRANANYSAAKTAENLDKKMVAAELRANSSNSGMNVANAIRQNMRQIVTKPKEARGLTQDELKTATSIVEGTRTQNALRAGGNLLGGGGGLKAYVSGAGGYLLGGPAGAALPLAGYAMKAISNKLTVRQAQMLSEAIRNRAPLASSMQKYEEAASGLRAGRNAKTMSGVVIAARNLSNNLRASGFNISPSELIMGLQTSGSASADEQ